MNIYFVESLSGKSKSFVVLRGSLRPSTNQSRGGSNTKLAKQKINYHFLSSLIAGFRGRQSTDAL